MKEKWNKYSYLNTDTDCLIEVTHLEGTEEKLLLTPLNNSPYVLMSVEDATIQPTNERNIMEIYGATVTPDTYNPNALVQYKVIDGEQVSFPITKVTDLEWVLENARQRTSEYYSLRNKVDGLEEQIVEWVNPNYDKDDVIRLLCEYFAINPSKQVTVTGTISFEVTVNVPLDEVDDFDAHYLLGDELSLDSNSSAVDINSWLIEDTDVDWN
jgi:hypothetical protein